MLQSQDTFTSDPGGTSSVVDDVAPSNMADGGTSEPVFTGFRGKYGLLKTNIVTSYATVGMLLGGPTSPDGILFLTSAEPIADAWISWGKTDPRYMKIVQVLWGGPFMTLILAHTPLAAGIMANHDIKIPGISRLLNPLNSTAFQNLRKGAAGVNAAAPVYRAAEPEPASEPPFVYVPAGAMAPTEAPPPPATYDGQERVFPEEGVPHGVDIQLRQLSREAGIPYEQVRDAYLLESAQARIAETTRLHPPATLGTPVSNPGA